jgi:uncharacterized membrane protein YesL
MQLSGTSGFIYRITDWMMKLALVNLLWIGFTLAGMIVFGFYPAWIAMCRLILCWQKGEDPPLVSTFWQTYRSAFVRGNLITVCFVLLAVVVYWNLYFISSLSGFMFYVFSFSTLLVFFLGAGWLLVTGVTLAEKTRGKITKSDLLPALQKMVFAPGKMFFLLIGIVAVYAANSMMPGLLPVYSVSIAGGAAVLLFGSRE